jgi:hypothetical protein
MKRDNFASNEIDKRHTTPSFIDKKGVHLWLLNNQFTIERRYLEPKEQWCWPLKSHFLGRTWLIGTPHREHGPAIVFNDEAEEQQWWLNGLRHRKASEGPQCTFFEMKEVDGVWKRQWVRQYAENGKLLRVEFENGEIWNYEKR